MTAGRIWVFDEGKLEEALARYETEAIRAYPGQEERIRVTVVAMRDFLYSKFADRLVMGGARENDEA